MSVSESPIFTAVWWGLRECSSKGGSESSQAAKRQTASEGKHMVDSLQAYEDAGLEWPPKYVQRAVVAVHCAAD